ncbi:AsmA family protein [Desulfotignum balticum]|uniref:AsmA family protein n=1 Tax=Desulfotignum balticum TaxID=115781 RepID=UPI0003FA5559|nr:AsmA family protein [Desulfotignum balticum]
MKKVFLLTLSGLGILILVAVAGAVIVLNLDPNRYKDYVAKKVSQQVGRTFEIQGDLRVKYYPWLHLEMSKIFLENAPGFGDGPMLTADYAMVRVKTLPLLKKQIEMDTLVLEGAQVHLARNQAGMANWKTQGGSPDKTKPHKPSAASSKKKIDLKNLAVLLNGGVRIQDARFSFDDRSTGKKYTLTDLNLTTGKVVPGAPVDWQLTFNGTGTSPKISGNAGLEGTLVFDLGSGQYQIDPMIFQARLAGPILGKKPADLDLACRVEMDLPQDTVSVKNLTASGLGTDVTGTIVLGNMGAVIPRIDLALDIAGKDLALLMQIIEGGPLAAHLARTGEKAFHVNMDMDMDLSQGRVLVPALDIAALGITLKGNVAARDLGTRRAEMEGKMVLEGRHLNRLLHALDQPVPGDFLDTVAGQVRFNGKQGNLTLDPLQIRLGLDGKKISNGPFSVTLDAPVHWQMNQQRLEVPAFSLSGMDLAVSGGITVEKIQTDPVYTGTLSAAPFNLRQLMKTLGLSLPATADARVFEKVGLKTRFTGSTNDLQLTGLSGVVDDSHLKGSFGVTDFSDPDITMDLAVDRIDVDPYLPKAPKQAKGKKHRSVPVTPETVAAGAATRMPVAQLRNLKINAALAIENLVVSGASLSRVQAKLTAKDGVIHAAPLSAALYNGVYHGSMMLDAAEDIPLITINSSLKGIEVAPLLDDMTEKAMIRGTGDITAALTTRGATVSAMKQHLNGNLSFLFKNGAVIGFNVGKFLRSLKSLRDTRTFSVSEAEETDFTELAGNPVVTNGVVVLDDLSGKSPALRVSGTGTVVDIVKETIDYRAMVTVVETSRGQAGSELAELAGIPVPIYIRGPLADPAIQPDIKGVITSILTGTSPEAVEQLKQSVEKELGRFLKKLTD